MRNIRTELNVKPGEPVRLFISAGDNGAGAVFDANMTQIKRLTRASDVTFHDAPPRASARAVLTGGSEVAVPLEGLIDFAQESARLGKEQAKLRAEAERLDKQLSNPQFVQRAPAEKVEELRQRVADIGNRLRALAQMLEALGG